MPLNPTIKSRKSEDCKQLHPIEFYQSEAWHVFFHKTDVCRQEQRHSVLADHAQSMACWFINCARFNERANRPNTQYTHVLTEGRADTCQPSAPALSSAASSLRK